MMTREQRARNMRSFYEPGYYGGASSYGEALSNWLPSDMPTQMGGFTFGREDEMELRPFTQMAMPGGFGQAIANSTQVRRAYDQPSVGRQNLGSYGLGQLNNYGRGALEAVGGLNREEDLRWRT